MCLQAGKASSVYATATLSGDVANALALLKRLTKPSSRKAQRGLLIPPDELAECEVRITPSPHPPTPRRPSVNRVILTLCLGLSMRGVLM